jgi:hypothetical protein
MFRPQRTTVLLAIVAEPAEKPDTRLLALDSNSPPTLVSQSVSPAERAFAACARRAYTGAMRRAWKGIRYRLEWLGLKAATKFVPLLSRKACCRLALLLGALGLRCGV